MDLVFCCSRDNDLYRVLSQGGTKCPRFESAAEAVAAAEPGSGALVLASERPDETTVVPDDVLARAKEKNLRLYVEFPKSLPGIEVGDPKEARFERGVVASDFFGGALEPLRIVSINACRYAPTSAPKAHLVLAKVAGVDRAVFGLEDTETRPLLFEHPNGNLLVATTKLSHFVTGRYMPSSAWAAIWSGILSYLQPGKTPPELKWESTVRPSYRRDDPLPGDAERQALARCADWFVRARMLRHPDWPQEALDRSLTYNTVRDMPAADWPLGDGSLGILEGFSSTIRLDGSQPMRYAVRNDCTTEIAMALALDAVVCSRPETGRIATNLLDYIMSGSPLAQGPRADPASPSYGLVGWELDMQHTYYGDDNARAMLSILAVASLLENSTWDDAMARCLLGNLRITGVGGFRGSSTVEPSLQARGWESYWRDDVRLYSPHSEAWLWACFLWAYEETGYEPFLARSKTGFRLLMEGYPNDWDWCLRSGSIELARALLPLAWLVRVEDTPEHRAWLRRIAQDLIALQDESGGIREIIGGNGRGSDSNAEYGARETSLIQNNGDPVADMLYTCNFALIGLHEAAAATGEKMYADAEEKLADFLCRIQIRSEEHPELDGAWYRAFHFKEWDYWASNADWEWGAWCTESGWAQPWIAGTFALREMKTSLWDLVAARSISQSFEKYRKQMMPDDQVRAAPTLDVEAKPRPDISLTLIPPSPVTDKIALDVRGAVWNRTNKPVELDVAFYIDEEKPANLLHRERLKVAAESAASASFRWPTKGRAGKHRIVFQASCSGDALRTVQALEVLASDVRSTRGIDGAWIEFYHWSEAEGGLWNAEIKRMTDGQWRELVRGMHEIGMNVGVIQDVFRQETNQYVGQHDMNVDNYPGKAMYPSRIYPARLGLAAKDPVEAVLSEADKIGMHVFMGVGGFAWFDFTRASLEWHKKIAAELWEMYGHHPSFYGWYVSAEVGGDLGTDSRRRSEIVEFFREFTAHCRAMAPDKPVMLATNCHHLKVKEGRDAYPELLAHLDILCPFGFHRMPEGDYTGEEAAAVLQKLCDDAGAHLWMDLEAFLQDGGGALYPRPIQGLIEDLNRFPTFEKILCYQYPGLFSAPWASRKPGGEDTVALYRSYKAYREGGVIPDRREARGEGAESFEDETLANPEGEKR